MTTLPQAAALRLPRPAFSNLPVAAVPVGGAVGYPQQSAVSAMTGADVWRVIRSNLWLILLMLIVSAAAGYGMNYWLLRYHPRYTAVGRVLVLGTVEDTAAGSASGDQFTRHKHFADGSRSSSSDVEGSAFDHQGAAESQHRCAVDTVV